MARPRLTRSPLATTSMNVTIATLKRIDRLARIATRENGRTITRNLIVRELLEIGLNYAERVRREARREARS